MGIWHAGMGEFQTTSSMHSIKCIVTAVLHCFIGLDSTDANKIACECWCEFRDVGRCAMFVAQNMHAFLAEIFYRGEINTNQTRCIIDSQC